MKWYSFNCIQKTKSFRFPMWNVQRESNYLILDCVGYACGMFSLTNFIIILVVSMQCSIETESMTIVIADNKSEIRRRQQNVCNGERSERERDTD